MANQFNPSNFNFYKSDLDKAKNRSFIPEFDEKENIFSALLHFLGFGVTVAFFIVSLIYILSNENYHYSQGGIGTTGVIAVSLFFTVVLLNVVVSFLYLHKLRNNKYSLVYNKIRYICFYMLFASYMFLFSSVALRIDICGNALINTWFHYGSLINVLTAVMFTVLVLSLRLVKKEENIRYINLAVLSFLAVFTISNYFILQSSPVVGQYNMWTIIISTALILAAVIQILSSRKKNYAFVSFELLVFLGLVFYALGIIYFGCKMAISIPHIV